MRSSRALKPSSFGARLAADGFLSLTHAQGTTTNPKERCSKCRYTPTGCCPTNCCHTSCCPTDCHDAVYRLLCNDAVCCLLSAAVPAANATAYCLLSTVCCLLLCHCTMPLSAACCTLPSAVCFATVCCLLSTVCCLLPMPLSSAVPLPTACCQCHHTVTTVVLSCSCAKGCVTVVQAPRHTQDCQEAVRQSLQVPLPTLSNATRPDPTCRGRKGGC